MVAFLKDILQEINTFSSWLNLDNTSGTAKMSNYSKMLVQMIFIFE